MSHFTKIKTELKDLNLLKASLTDLRIVWDLSSDDGLHNQFGVQDSNINLILKQPNGYHIGFVWDGMAYHLIADLQFWQQAWPIDVFLGRLSQRYAYNYVLKMSTEKGFKAVEEVSESSGAITVVIQRWK